MIILRVVQSAGGSLGLLASRTGSRSSLAGVWQQAASAVEAYLHPMPQAPACPRPLSSSSAVLAASSEPQRASDAEEAPSHRSCWQCGTGLGPRDMFFCPECHSIQPPDNDAETKYFQAFDLPPGGFDVDPAALEQRYKQLQLQLHPDRFSVGSALEKEYSDQQAALVNQAYAVLKRPLRRAHYILQQQGLGACEGLTITDPELLMYVMEAREEVEGTEDHGKLQQLLAESHKHEQRLVQDLSDAFRRSDLSRAAELTTQLRYLKRIQEAIVDKL